MASRPATGGASAPPTVLPFPQTERALWHYSNRMDAAGFLSLLLMERGGEPIPANVQRFDEPDGAELPSRSPALMLAMLLFDALSAKQRDRIRQTVRGLAYSKDPMPDAVALNNALRIGALNGRAK